MLIDNEEVVLDLTQKSFLSREREKKIIEKTNLYKFRYLVEDDVPVDGYYAIPYGVNQKLPVIIWCRGGFKEEGKLDDFTAFITLGEIAQWGYCVFASQYRTDDVPGLTDLKDVSGMIQLVEEFNFTDSDNLALEGWSRGGLVALSCLRFDYKIKCAIVVAGLSDLIEYCNSNSNMKLIMETICKKNKEYKISPVDNYKDLKKIPILFIHGTGDEIISYRQSVKMYNLLKEYNPDVNYELELINYGTHTLKENRDYVSAVRKKWYDKYLKIHNDNMFC